MILVDYREDRDSRSSGAKKGNKDLLVHVRRIIGPVIGAQEADLEYGDFAFDGNGPGGAICIGIERKSLHDMLHCIEDSRYSAHQKVGMAQMYQKQYLIVEGYWKANHEGFLLESRDDGNGWFFCKVRSSRILYSKLYRYLLSVSGSGVEVLHSRDLFQTAYNVCETYHYWQKPWASHTSQLQSQVLNIPSLSGKVGLVGMWAADIDGVGVKHRMAAERYFKTPVELAIAEPEDWRNVGLGAKMAAKVVKQIRGLK